MARSLTGGVDRDEPADDVVHTQRAQRISQAYGVWVAIASCAGASGPEQVVTDAEIDSFFSEPFYQLMHLTLQARAMEHDYQ